MSIRRILIANRGEIALRINRAAKELGIKVIQVYSDADKDSLPVELADEAICIGGPRSADSYLNIDKIVGAAIETQADAIHPGYGFLAENAAFAEKVERAGIRFVGPSSDTIRKMGDKVSAIKIARETGVPIVPGSGNAFDSAESAEEAVHSFPFPVVIKASAGGGGRGIRIVESPQDFGNHFRTAKAEAEAAFGDGSLYVEQMITNAHHVEVQILGDGKEVVHCFERQCSLQRRRQKVWEEAPAVFLTESTRKEICEAAVKISKAVAYKGAGTVEFLYDSSSGRFYFIEMNTRIQVEHPVTEMITGMDLIKEMILIAEDKPLRFKQEDIQRKGHAIEIRINAEDPAQNFMPFPGIVERLDLSGGPGVRFDSLIRNGYAVPPFYDSMIGKLIVWDETRDAAIARLKRVLAEIRIEGLKTTLPLFKALVDDRDIRECRINTNWLECWLEKNTGILTQ